jgi:hypothetical protein
MSHIPTCTRTVNTYDENCPRCQDLRLRSPMERERTQEEQVQRQQKDIRDEHISNALGVTISAVMLAPIVAAGLGALYLLVKFVKWAWAN